MTETSKQNQILVFHAMFVSNTLKGKDKTSNIYEIRDVLESMGYPMSVSEILHYLEALIQHKLVRFFDPEKGEHRFYSPTNLGRTRWAKHQAGIKE